MKFVIYMLTVLATVTLMASMTHAQDVQAEEYAFGVASAVTSGVFTAGSEAEATGCLAGDIDDCVDVLLDASTVVDLDLAYELRTMARRLLD